MVQNVDGAAQKCIEHPARDDQSDFEDLENIDGENMLLGALSVEYPVEEFDLFIGNQDPWRSGPALVEDPSWYSNTARNMGDLRLPMCIPELSSPISLTAILDTCGHDGRMVVVGFTLL